MSTNTSTEPIPTTHSVETPAPARTSKKVATGHIKVPDICDVFDAEYRYVYTVPKDSMSHIPPNFFNVSASRLVLCRNGDNGECVKGPECKFIHVNRPLSTFQKQEIHINYAWRDLDAVLYPRTKNACEEQTVSVLYPTTAGQIDATNDYTTTVGLREEHIPASHIIATEGSRRLSELSAPTAEPLLACLDFYLDRVCKCGPTCKRIHVAHLDAEAKAFQRAPAMRLVLLDAQKAIDEARRRKNKKERSKKAAALKANKKAAVATPTTVAPEPKVAPKAAAPRNANLTMKRPESPLVPTSMKSNHTAQPQPQPQPQPQLQVQQAAPTKAQPQFAARPMIAFTPPPQCDFRMVRRSPNRLASLPTVNTDELMGLPTIMLTSNQQCNSGSNSPNTSQNLTVTEFGASSSVYHSPISGQPLLGGRHMGGSTTLNDSTASMPSSASNSYVWNPYNRTESRDVLLQ